MSIQVIQQPLALTPSNAQHVYNVVSTLSGSTDFRYVFDIYINPYQTTSQRIARVRIAPNTSGRGIVDVGDIIKNYTKGNVRTDKPISTNGVGGTSTTPNGILSAAGEFNYLPSNAFNTNTSYETLQHVLEYRVIIGEQYTNASGTTTLNICSDASQPPSTFSAGTTSVAAAYTGTPNTIVVTNAGVNIPPYSTELRGWNYQHYTSGGTLITSGTTTASSGSYTPSGAPSTYDIVYVTENYSGVRYTYQWQVESLGFDFVSEYTGGICFSNPGAKTIWPGTQENKTNFNYNNVYWSGNTNGSNNGLYYEAYKYRFTGSTSQNDNNPAQFLTAFGDELFTSTFINYGTGFTSNRVRRRNHHYQCPVLISHFWTDNGLFDNASTSVVPYNYSSSQNTPYTNLGSVTGITYTGGTVLPDFRIVYSVPNYQMIQSGGKLATWRSNGTGEGVFLNNFRISEVVEYYFYGEDCMSDPQHFLFLNRRGVWDTWTFDRKNIKRYNKETSTYAQGTIRDNSTYNPFFYDKRAVIYDQYTTEVVEAQSDFMTENDRVIVEELFLSTDVYLISNHYYPMDTASTYSKTPYLIPIVITSNSLEEYKQRYNKLFQYTLTYEYNPNQLYRTTL